MENECEALPGVAYPGVRDNRSTINTKTGYDDDMMVGVDSGSLYRQTHSLSRLAWSWVGGCLAPFYIHQINRVNSHNGSAMMTAP